jgi:hypothetical protein
MTRRKLEWEQIVPQGSLQKYRGGNRECTQQTGYLRVPMRGWDGDDYGAIGFEADTLDDKMTSSEKKKLVSKRRRTICV